MVADKCCCFYRRQRDASEKGRHFGDQGSLTWQLRWLLQIYGRQERICRQSMTTMTSCDEDHENVVPSFFLTVLLLVLMLPKRFCGRN